MRGVAANVSWASGLGGTVRRFECERRGADEAAEPARSLRSAWRSSACAPDSAWRWPGRRADAGADERVEADPGRSLAMRPTGSSLADPGRRLRRSGDGGNEASSVDELEW